MVLLLKKKNSEKGIVSKENTDPMSVGCRLKAAFPILGRILN